MKQKPIFWILGGGCSLLVLACLGAYLFVQWQINKSKQEEIANTITIGSTDAAQTTRYKLQMLNGFDAQAADPSSACKDDVPNGQYYVFLAFQIEKQVADTDSFDGFISWQLVSPNDAIYESEDISSTFLSCTIGANTSDDSIFKPAYLLSENKLVMG